MDNEINLTTSLPIYQEYNNLTYNYLRNKLLAKENLEEILSKIHPKFKTPIKYSSNYIKIENDDRKIKCYKRPIYYAMNESITSQNSYYDKRCNKNKINIRKINNHDNNEITRDNSYDNILTKNSVNMNSNNNRKVYYKTPIKDRKKYMKKGKKNLYRVNKNECDFSVNESESNIKIMKKNMKKSENQSKQNNYNKKITEINYMNNNNDSAKNIYKKNIAKSYDNTIFKQKIQLVKKKKRTKIVREKTYDNINKIIYHSKTNSKIYKNKSLKVDIPCSNKKYRTISNKYEINKVIFIQNWWKSINQKRIENFIEKFKKYRLIKKGKKYNIDINLNLNKRYLENNKETINFIKKENNLSIFKKLAKITGAFYITKNKYTNPNSSIIFLQRKIKEFLFNKNTILKKPVCTNLFILKLKGNINKLKNKIDYKIERNCIYEIFPSIIKDKQDLKNSGASTIKYSLLSINEICKEANINYIKNEILKCPINNKMEYISKEVQYNKEYNTKILKNQNKRNIVDECFKSYSTIDNTEIKTKRSLTEDQSEINTYLKNNNNIMQKDYLNKLSEFILFLLQKINKNINQFVFYKIKYGKIWNNTNIFFDNIKRIINIYNNLLKKENEKDDFNEILKFINNNLSKNIENYNRYKYISFIPNDNENNLVNTQLVSNDKQLRKLINIILKIENNIYPDNNICIQELIKNEKLKNRNIFTIIRYSDALYEQIIKNNKIINSKNSILKKKNPNSFSIKPIIYKKIINNNSKNKCLSFSYLTYPNIHLKYKSNENFEIINNILINNTKSKKANIYYSITKENKYKNNSCSSGEIDVFQKIINDNYYNEQQEKINQIYEDYCFDKYNRINVFEDDEENFDKNKVRHVSKLSDESEVLKELDYYEEEIILNEIKESFQDLNA